MSRARTTLITVLALLAAPSVAQANFNLLNGQTLGDTPYRSAQPFDRTTTVFDNMNFDEETGEENGKFLGCGSWGSKTAWVRFATDVAGELSVDVDSSIAPSPGHDVIYWVFRAPTTIPVGTASHSELVTVDPTCSNIRTGLPDEIATPGGFDIPARQVMYVEVASVCNGPDPGPTYQCDPFEQANAPGGRTSIRLRFRPFDGDRDQTADSLDNCVTAINADQADQDQDARGDVCDDDRDGDGRVNTADNCVTISNPTQTNQDGDLQGDPCDDNRDGDPRGNSSATGDCRPDNPRIYSGAPEIRGNRRDEDCDGKDAPFRRLATNIEPVFLFDSQRDVLGIAYFLVGPLRPGMRVRLECKGATCPGRTTRKLPSKGRKRVIFARGAKRLKVGTQVTIKLIRRRFVGRAVRYTIDGKSFPKKANFCLNPPNQFREVQRRYQGTACR